MSKINLPALVSHFARNELSKKELRYCCEEIKENVLNNKEGYIAINLHKFFIRYNIKHDIIDGIISFDRRNEKYYRITEVSSKAVIYSGFVKGKARTIFYTILDEDELFFDLKYCSMLAITERRDNEKEVGFHIHYAHKRFSMAKLNAALSFESLIHWLTQRALPLEIDDDMDFEDIVELLASEDNNG